MVYGPFPLQVQYSATYVLTAAAAENDVKIERGKKESG
jgi:hypothetical protein